jgi:Cu(I)/Ag(I) efflux system membrane fusion protein
VLRASEREAALMNIETARATRRPVTKPIPLSGRLGPDETRLKDVVVRVDSYVEKLYADYRWRRVEKGQRIAELYTPALNAAARELLAARKGREDGKGVDLSAARARLRRLGATPDHIERILEQGEVPRTHPIHSPMDGHLMHVAGEEGHWLKEGQRLVQIMDPSQLWAQLEVYERDLQWIERGMAVTLSLKTFPGETFEGTVDFLDPHVQNMKRTARARVKLPNPHMRLRPGMFVEARAQARIETAPWAEKKETARPPLVIPASAVLWTGEDAVVYVKRKEADRPSFEGRRIELGPRAGEHYLVRNGLTEGELVVTRGAFRIDSELQIQGEPSMMNPERGAGGGHDAHGASPDSEGGPS